MCPLELEAYHPTERKWIKFGEPVGPGGGGSISDNKSEGRNVYLFFCNDDDSGSTIVRSKGGADSDLAGGRLRYLVNLSGYEVVKELKKGESFEMTLKPDTLRIPLKFRFSHK